MGPKSNPASHSRRGNRRGERRHDEFPSLKRLFPKKNRPLDEEEAGHLTKLVPVLEMDPHTCA
jgi:hypothetical protein